jgi:hypothetical protein
MEYLGVETRAKHLLAYGACEAAYRAREVAYAEYDAALTVWDTVGIGSSDDLDGARARYYGACAELDLALQRCADVVYAVERGPDAE